MLLLMPRQLPKGGYFYSKHSNGIISTAGEKLLKFRDKTAVLYLPRTDKTMHHTRRRTAHIQPFTLILLYAQCIIPDEPLRSDILRHLPATWSYVSFVNSQALGETGLLLAGQTPSRNGKPTQAKLPPLPQPPVTAVIIGRMPISTSNIALTERTSGSEKKAQKVQKTANGSLKSNDLSRSLRALRALEFNDDRLNYTCPTRPSVSVHQNCAISITLRRTDCPKLKDVTSIADEDVAHLWKPPFLEWFKLSSWLTGITILADTPTFLSSTSGELGTILAPAAWGIFGTHAELQPKTVKHAAKMWHRPKYESNHSF